MNVLRYGYDASLELDIDEPAISQPALPRGEPLNDVAAAAKNILAQPLDYPALAACTTPVDRVVLVLERGGAQTSAVAAATIQVLIEAGVDPEGITLLQEEADREAGAGDPRDLLAPALREQINLLFHNPAERRELAYLAAGESGEAILINRAIHEADVILPIGCIRSPETAGYFGIHASVYPTFSDTKTLQRFRGLGSLDGGSARKRELIAEVEHVAWLLGISFTIQVVPAAGDQIMHVLAGESESVQRRGLELYHAAWDCPIEKRASLVLAAIDGSASQQTWENVGRALQVASCFVEEGGAIAICSELATRPGPALQHLTTASSHEAALRHLGKERPIDALAAAQVARTLDRNKVYLLSRLDASTVEDLEMIPVADPVELSRLVRHHASCVLLSSAARVSAIRQQHA